MSSIQNTSDLIEFTDHADSIDKSAGSVVQIVQNTTVGELPTSLIAAAVAKITTATTNKSQTSINKSESGSCESPDLIASVTTATSPLPATITAAAAAVATAADNKTLPQVCIHTIQLMFSFVCMYSFWPRLIYY